MKNKKKTLFFIVKNVIFESVENNYKKNNLISEIINFINILYKQGFQIKIFITRYMEKNNEKISCIKRQVYTFATRQLNKWGLRYNHLIFEKPTYNIFMDDKALGFEKNLTISFKKVLKEEL